MNAYDKHQLLNAMLENLRRTAVRLEESLAVCAAFIPADKAEFDNMDGLSLERLEALGARYARCQEFFGKALQSCAVFIGIPAKPFAVMIDGLRVEGLALPLNDWTTLRGLRNQTGHVYLMSSDDFVAYFQEIVIHGPALLAAVRALRDFADKTIGAPPAP